MPLALIAAAMALLASNIALAAIPDNGLPDSGLPDNGLPDNGLLDNGLPDNGNSPDALVNSTLFFDPATHAYWVSNPFTAATMAVPGNPLTLAISDPLNAMVMSFVWQLCHPQGDDATVVDAFGKAHTFHGRVGLCVLPGGHGWQIDQALDYGTARYLSSAVITQVNRSQVHNRYSLRGPTSDLTLPGARGNQLTSMTASLTSYPYAFGTDQPIKALGACDPTVFSTGLAPCGWKAHFVGLAQPGSIVRVSANSQGVPMILQINLGIHAANPGDPTALAVSGSSGVINPTVQFIVPVGGTWNVQWAADPRPTSTSLPATIAPPTLSVSTIAGNGNALRFPADEVFVFPNREMYSTAMIFNLSSGDANITPIPGVASTGDFVADCAPRINPDARTEFCDASAPNSCLSCRRTSVKGALSVIFPNAHTWLASSWTNAQAYYQVRSCTADSSVCVSSFEGFIDASYCGPADPHCLSSSSQTVAPRCHVQSLDNDTANPLPYTGGARKLYDAFQCHIGSGPDTGYGVTTFFANYGTQGACWATTSNDPNCQYVNPN